MYLYRKIVLSVNELDKDREVLKSFAVLAKNALACLFDILIECQTLVFTVSNNAWTVLMTRKLPALCDLIIIALFAVLINYAARAAIYAMGLVILAAGITMNIKTGLGVSTIISVPFAISSIWNVNFSLVTFATYALFVVIEMIIKGSDRTVIDWLQIPFSIVFSLLLNMFSKLLDFN